MRTSWMLIALCVVPGGTASIAAGQTPVPRQFLGAQAEPAGPPAIRFGRRGVSPSEALGVAMERAKQQARQDGRVARKPAVVCGMTLIPGDMSIDPGIRAPAPTGDVWHTIRALPPPVCNPASPEASKR